MAKNQREHFLMSAMTGFIGLRLEPNFTKVSSKEENADMMAAQEFLKCFEKLLIKVCIYPSMFLMRMRQNCTGRKCQTKVTPAWRKS